MFNKDIKKLEIMKYLRMGLVILKPEKGSGIVLNGTNDYYANVENLFLDKSRFKKLARTHGLPKAYKTFDNILFFFFLICN